MSALITTHISAQTKQIDTSSKAIMDPIEIWPSYPGGIEKFQAFVMSHVKVSTNVKGRVIATFVVEKSGRLTDAKILRGLRPDIDSAIVHIIPKSRRWKPGMQSEQVVRVAYTVPFNFK